MPRDEPGRSQHLVRGPPVAVEDARLAADHARGGMDDHLARKMAHDPDVVVPEHELDVQTLPKELTEEVENDRPQCGRGPDDRMLRVSGDHHGACPGSPRETDELVRESLGRPLGGAERSVGCAAEPEMQVRDDEGPRLRGPGRFDDQRRCIGDRA